MSRTEPPNEEIILPPVGTVYDNERSTLNIVTIRKIDVNSFMIFDLVIIVWKVVAMDRDL